MICPKLFEKAVKYEEQKLFGVFGENIDIFTGNHFHRLLTGLEYQLSCRSDFKINRSL